MNFIKVVVQYMHHIVLGNLPLPNCKIPGLVMVVCAYSDICRCECCGWLCCCNLLYSALRQLNILQIGMH